MDWPLASDFNRILQTPQIAFADHDLRSCVIETNSLGQPRPRSGNFATVYKGTYPDGRHVAIRVFNRGVVERRERYDIVSEFLKDRELDCLVKFAFREKGIRSAGDGKMYPLVTMEWVSDETLFSWLQAQCQASDRAALAQCASRWQDLLAELHEAQIAHGDLQHGNVMVNDSGQLKLVDYDGMCVAGLVGRPNLEVGLAAYQHPMRDADTPLSLSLDNFSALVIYVTLRALAVDPGLWQRHIATRGDECLLFRRENLADPATSETCRDVLESPDSQVRTLARFLFDLYHANINEVPSLQQALTELHISELPDMTESSMDLADAGQFPNQQDEAQERPIPSPTTDDLDMVTEAGNLFVDQFYMRVRGHVLGPYDIEKLAALARRGQLSKLHEVSADGVTWQKASEVPAVSALVDGRDASQPMTGSLPNQEPTALDETGTAEESALDEVTAADPSSPPSLTGSSVWYFVSGDELQGPTDFRTLQLMAIRGELKAIDLVWSEGMPAWVPANAIPGLAAGLIARGR